MRINPVVTYPDHWAGLARAEVVKFVPHGSPCELQSLLVINPNSRYRRLIVSPGDQRVGKVLLVFVTIEKQMARKRRDINPVEMVPEKGLEPIRGVTPTGF